MRLCHFETYSVMSPLPFCWNLFICPWDDLFIKDSKMYTCFFLFLFPSRLVTISPIYLPLCEGQAIIQLKPLTTTFIDCISDYSLMAEVTRGWLFVSFLALWPYQSSENVVMLSSVLGRFSVILDVGQSNLNCSKQ